MANGDNEPVVFTRADSDRLTRIEGKLDDLVGAFNGLKNTVVSNGKQTIRNTTWIKAIRYVVGGSGFGLILVVLRVFGVL